jgi:hypothetical protein
MDDDQRWNDPAGWPATSVWVNLSPTEGHLRNLLFGKHLELGIAKMNLGRTPDRLPRRFAMSNADSRGSRTGGGFEVHPVNLAPQLPTDESLKRGEPWCEPLVSRFTLRSRFLQFVFQSPPAGNHRAASYYPRFRRVEGQTGVCDFLSQGRSSQRCLACSSKPTHRQSPGWTKRLRAKQNQEYGHNPVNTG